MRGLCFICNTPSASIASSVLHPLVESAFVSGRSLNSSRKSEFGDSGHCRISTSNVSKIAADRPLSKMRQCAIDPKRTSQKLRDFGADPVRQASLTLRERERGIVSSTLDVMLRFIEVIQ